jgi:hypothetical protein
MIPSTTLSRFLLDADEVELCLLNPELDPCQPRMTEDGFLLQFKGWCDATGQAMPVWRPDTYQSTFEDYGISKRLHTRVYEGVEWNAPMLLGLRTAVPLLARYLLDANEIELCHHNPVLDHSETFLPEEDLKVHFGRWCDTTGRAAPAWHPDMYQSVFEAYDISRLMHTRLCNDIECNTSFLFGLRVALSPLAQLLLDANEIELCLTTPGLSRNDTYMLEESLKSHYKLWCKMKFGLRGDALPPWRPDMYEPVFLKYGITRHEGAPWISPFLTGLRLA